MKTILVVDDQDSFRVSIQGILQKFGFNVLAAANGQEGLKFLEQAVPDLILLDVTMPVMDGLTFLTALRANSSWSAIPVILLTGLSDRASVTQAAKLGASGYLVKASFSTSYLVEKIEKILKLDLDFMNMKSTNLIDQSDQTLNKARENN